MRGKGISPKIIAVGTFLNTPVPNRENNKEVNISA